MKTTKTFLWPALLASISLTAPGRAGTRFDSLINHDGAFPASGLVISGGALYGTAQAGGDLGYGVVYALNMDGSGFMNLHSFAGTDGMNPYAQLTSSGELLYGTANSGGGTGSGTVF